MFNWMGCQETCERPPTVSLQRKVTNSRKQTNIFPSEAAGISGLPKIQLQAGLSCRCSSLHLCPTNRSIVRFSFSPIEFYRNSLSKPSHCQAWADDPPNLSLALLAQMIDTCQTSSADVISISCRPLTVETSTWAGPDTSLPETWMS